MLYKSIPMFVQKGPTINDIQYLNFAQMGKWETVYNMGFCFVIWMLVWYKWIFPDFVWNCLNKSNDPPRWSENIYLKRLPNRWMCIRYIGVSWFQSVLSNLDSGATAMACQPNKKIYHIKMFINRENWPPTMQTSFPDTKTQLQFRTICLLSLQKAI